MSTATLTTPAPQADPTAGLPTVAAMTAKTLRALHDAAPTASLDALKSRSGRFPHPCDLLKGDGRRLLPDALAKAREALRAHRDHQAQLAYLQALSAGADADYSPPAPDLDEEASEILRAVLDSDGAAFGDLVRFVDGKLGVWRAELETLERPAEIPEFQLPTAEGGSTNWPAVHDERARALEVMTAFLDGHAKKLARLPELSGLIARVGPARDRLEAAYLARVAKVVQGAGGPAVLTEALRESSRLGDAGRSADGAELLAGLQSDLADVNGKLAMLGVDPASGPPAGLAAQALLSERSELAARIDGVKEASASRESAMHGTLVADAMAFEPSAWSKILASCRAQTRAFPADFEAAWSTIPLDCFRDAGPADFVEPFEAS